METIMTYALLAVLLFGAKVVWLGKKSEETKALPMDLHFHKRFQNRFLG